MGRVPAFLIALALGLLASCAQSSVVDDDGSSDSGAAAPSFASSAYLAIDDTSLYWCDSRRGFVMRPPRGGGEAVEFVEMPARAHSWIAVNDTSIFWFDRRLDAGLIDYALVRTALDGSDTTFLAMGGRTGNVVTDERSAFIIAREMELGDSARAEARRCGWRRVRDAPAELVCQFVSGE